MTLWLVCYGNGEVRIFHDEEAAYAAMGSSPAVCIRCIGVEMLV